MANPDNNELQEAIELVDTELFLEREGIQYRRTRGRHGTQLNVKECPCCGNSEYKVYLNAENGLGNCFAGSCEQKFNRWLLIKSYFPALSNREIVDYIKTLASEHGWMPKRKERQYEAVTSTSFRLPESVECSPQAGTLGYLTKRGISAATALQFGLRYSEKGIYVFDGPDGNELYQDYSQRVIIPVHNLEGKTINFQGRDITGAHEKKYLFPPGLESTGSILYNGHRAVGANSIIIGEGAFDVMAIHIAIQKFSDMRGIVPVGTFGKHLSNGDDRSQFARLLDLKASGLKIVTFMWDGESKAIADAVEAALMVQGAGLIARVAVLPKDKDPNEVEAEVIKEAFWKATTINKLTATKMLLSLKK